MKLHHCIGGGIAAALLLAPAGSAQVAPIPIEGFEFLGAQTRLATAVSLDGNVVMGSTPVQELFRYAPGQALQTMRISSSTLITSVATGLDATGALAVGYETDITPVSRPYFWTAGTGLVDATPLFGANQFLMDVSAVNQFVALTTPLTAALPQAAVVHVPTGTFVALGTLPGSAGNPNRSSTPWGISPEGRYVVGASSYNMTNLAAAFRYDLLAPAGAQWIQLPFLPSPGTSPSSFAMDTSNSGSTVVGYGSSGNGTYVEAFAWTAAGGTVALGRLPGSINSFARAVSADGRIVVGDCQYPGFLRRAFLFDLSNAALGMLDLTAFLGSALPSGTILEQAHDVSGNGRTIVGSASSAAGVQAYRTY